MLPIPSDLGPLQPGGFDAAFSTISALIGFGFVAAVGIAIYRGVRLARRGVNPLTLQEDLTARVLQSDALAPSRSKSQRLDELDALRAAGRISDAEHATARARILSD